MIEFHPEPKECQVVDPLQAINFEEFTSLVSKLKNLAELLNKKKLFNEKSISFYNC